MLISNTVFIIPDKWQNQVYGFMGYITKNKQKKYLIEFIYCKLYEK